MLKIIFSQKEKSLMNYNVLDLGCGNGWVVRKLKEHSLCKEAHGIDGAKQMIKKAQAKDSDGTYFNHDILTWDNKTKYDIVFSMEVLYYFESPQLILNKIYNQILKPKGQLIIGIDYYIDNELSLDWPKKFQLDMTAWSIKKWKKEFLNTGFQNIMIKQVEKKKGWAGTLIIHGYKNEK